VQIWATLLAEIIFRDCVLWDHHARRVLPDAAVVAHHHDPALVVVYGSHTRSVSLRRSVWPVTLPSSSQMQRVGPLSSSPEPPEPSSSFSTSLTGSGAGCSCSFCLREDGFFLSSWCLSSWSSWSSFTRFPPRTGAGFAVVGVVVAASSPLEVLFGDFDWDAAPLVLLPLLPRPWSLLDMVGCQPSQTRAQSNSDPFAPPLHALFPLAAAISPLTSFCATPDNTSLRPAPDGSQTVDETPSFRNLPSPSQVSSLAFVNHSIQYRYQCSHIAASPDAPRRLPMVPPNAQAAACFPNNASVPYSVDQ
jgi:hypothetical protein